MSNAKVITVAGMKGGIGKSSIAFHILIELLKRGKRIAVIDADAKPNIYYLLNRREELIIRLQADYAEQNPEVAVDVQPIDQESAYFDEEFLSIMPKAVKAKLNLENMGLPDYTIYTAGGKASSNQMSQVEKYLANLLPNYDYIFVDTGGGDVNMNRAFMMLSDLVLIPVTPSILDTDIFPQMENVISECKATKPSLKFKSIVNQEPTHANDFRGEVLKYMLSLYPFLNDRLGASLSFYFAYRDSLSYGLGATEWSSGRWVAQVQILVDKVLQELE